MVATVERIEPLALRPREAAKALQVSERTLWAWTAAGDVPHVRRGKTVLYPVSRLRDWLEREASPRPAQGAGDPPPSEARPAGRIY